MNSFVRRGLGALFFLVACAGCNGKKSAHEATMESGESVYKTNCMSCHQPNGAGAKPMNPSLISTSLVLGNKDTLIDIVLHGMSGQEVDGDMYRNVMPPFDILSDQEIADVLTYIRNSFGNTASGISPAEVSLRRAKR